MRRRRRGRKFCDILTEKQTDTTQFENREQPLPALRAGHTLWEQSAWFNKDIFVKYIGICIYIYILI